MALDFSLQRTTMAKTAKEKEGDMIAVIGIGNRQYTVQEGTTIDIDKLPQKEGEKVKIEEVLALKKADGKVVVGKSSIKGASVEATVDSIFKGKKVIVFKKKRRKGYRVKNGARKTHSRITINTIKVKAKA